MPVTPVDLPDTEVCLDVAFRGFDVGTPTDHDVNSIGVRLATLHSELAQAVGPELSPRPTPDARVNAWAKRFAIAGESMPDDAAGAVADGDLCVMLWRGELTDGGAHE